MNKREEILRKANECVNGEREQQYGSPEDNFKTIAEFWSTYLGTTIEADDVAMMMVLLKAARIKGGNYKMDSYIDVAGYAACAGEISAPDNIDTASARPERVITDDCSSKPLIEDRYLKNAECFWE